MEWIIGIVTGLISGLVTGTLTCWYFYWRSGKDLKQEAENLRQLNILIIHALVQARLAEVNFDSKGKPIGLVYRLPEGATSGSISGSATPEVLHIHMLHRPGSADRQPSKF